MIITLKSCGQKPVSVAKHSYLTDDIVNLIIHHNENPLTARHIKKNVKTHQNSIGSLLTISEQEVKKILKELSTEKLTRVDMMPSELVKLAANYLARPLSQSINNSIKKGCFPKKLRLPRLLSEIRKQTTKTLY